MAVFYLSRLDAYFLIIIAGIDNTERVASDFSNDMTCNLHIQNVLHNDKEQKRQDTTCLNGNHINKVIQ